MTIHGIRRSPSAVRRGLAACGFLSFLAVPQAARGQCSPQELEKLTASDGAVDDVFGITVAISGDTAVVGAYTDDHAGGIDAR